MRQFIIVGHDVPTTPDPISLDDLPGAGRLDLLCRCVATGVFLSHGIRKDVRVHLICGDALTVTFDSNRLRHLHPDERNVAARIRDALAARADAIGHMPADVSPGVELRRMGLEATLDRVVGDGSLVTLHEDGDPLVEATPPTDPVFVLSDHGDFTVDEAALLDERADHELRVGPELLHADHTVSVAHNWLDTDGYTSY